MKTVEAVQRGRIIDSVRFIARRIPASAPESPKFKNQIVIAAEAATPALTLQGSPSTGNSQPLTEPTLNGPL